MTKPLTFADWLGLGLGLCIGLMGLGALLAYGVLPGQYVGTPVQYRDLAVAAFAAGTAFVAGWVLAYAREYD